MNSSAAPKLDRPALMSISLDTSKHLRSTETAADTLAALQQLIEGACSVARRAGPRRGPQPYASLSTVRQTAGTTGNGMPWPAQSRKPKPTRAPVHQWQPGAATAVAVPG